MSVLLTTLSLGDFTFSNLEIPESINFGGTQDLAVQQQVGGMRQVNAMGRNDADITWSGIFKGFTALYRARYLDGLRAAGKPLTLSYSQFLYSVVIKEFHANFQQNSYRMPYSITVTVVQDLTTPILFNVPDTILTAVQDALIEALALADLIANPSFSSAIAVLAVAVNGIGSFAAATQAQITSVLSAISGAQGIASEGYAAAQTSLFG